MRHALHAAVLASLAVAPAAPASGDAPGGRVAATLYGGVLTRQDWQEIALSPRDTEFESGGLAIAGLSRRMHALAIGDFGAVAWEAEALLTRHRGAQSHWELALAPAAVRWHAPGAPVSAAFSLGLSAASSIPEAERVTKGGSNAVMAHRAIDLEVGPPRAPDRSLVGRLHHRSTGCGLFGDLGGGDALILGLRRRFRRAPCAGLPYRGERGSDRRSPACSARCPTRSPASASWRRRPWRSSSPRCRGRRPISSPSGCSRWRR